MTEPAPIGERLDALGITASFDPGDLVADAIVIMRVIDGNGRSRAKLAWSEGQDWIGRRGLIEAARDVERIAPGDYE